MFVAFKFWFSKSQSKIQYFPSDLAYPIGGSPNEFKYFKLEIHYHNPQSLQGSYAFILDF